MRINSFLLLAGLLAFLFSACGEENPAVFPMNSTASEMTSSSIQNAEISSSSLATSTLSSSEQTEPSSQTTLSSFLTVEHSSSVDATSSSSNLSSSGFGPVSFGEITDERDGHVYKTVKIGEQIWMAENLNYAYPKQDSSLDSVSWCYNNEPDNCAKYGRLYTWEAAMDCYTQFGDDKKKCGSYHASKAKDYDYGMDYRTQGVCPKNWHVSSYGEWDVLTALANEKSIYLKSTSGWSENGNGSDIFGFGVLPGGIYDRNNQWIRNADYVMELDCGYGDITSFWTTGQFTYLLDDYTYDHAISICFSSQIETYPDPPIHKSWGLSVRCVKDAETSE